MENEKQITSSLDTTRRGTMTDSNEKLNCRKMFAPLWDLQMICATLSHRLRDNMYVQCHLMQGPLTLPCISYNAIESVHPI